MARPTDSAYENYTTIQRKDKGMDYEQQLFEKIASDYETPTYVFDERQLV